MIEGRRVCVVLPAYNAEQTLARTLTDLPRESIDDVILVDDASSDETVARAGDLGIHVVRHDRNLGYGANQKTCYRAALERDADIVVMLHPDYQYPPQLVPVLAGAIATGLYDVALGSRILSGGALAGGMPMYKYVANRALTLVQNLLLAHKLSEYHTGFRAFTRDVLETLPLAENDDGFVFDNQMLAQAIYHGFRICEVTCPTRYFEEASSIRFWPAAEYGLGVLATSIEFRLARLGLVRSRLFD